MSVKKKKKRRLVFLLAGAMGLAGLGAGGYFVRMQQVQSRLRQSRADGLEALKAEEYFNALHKVGAWLQRHPDDPEALYAYAQAREQVEEPNNAHIGQAARLYMRLLDLQPAHAEARHKLLDLYVRTGHGVEAMTTADELLRRNPADATAVRAKVIASASAGRYSDALRDAHQYNKLAPRDFEGYLLTVDMMFRSKQPAESVLELAKKLREAHPRDARFELLQSIACAGANDKAGATEWAGKAAAHPPGDPDVVVQLVRQLDMLGLFAESVAVLDRAAAREAASGQSAPAEPAANGARKADGAKIRRALATRWWQQKRYDRIVEYLKDLDPADRKADAELLALRAMALSKSKQPAEAVRVAESLAARKADSAAAAWAVVLPAVYGPAKAEPRKVVEVCQQALERLPGNPYIRFDLAEAYLRLGEGEVALEHFGRAFAAAPAWADPLLAMSRILNSSRRPFEAREAARLAGLRAPESVEAKALQAVAWAAMVSAPEDAEKLLAHVDDVQRRSPGEEQTLPVRIALLERFKSPAQAKQALQAAVSSPAPLSLNALLRLANLSREKNLGLEQLCLDRAEKDYGITPELAFLKAAMLEKDGKREEGLRLLEAARSKHEGNNKRTWGLAWARYLDQVGDPRAKEAWVALADGLPADMEVQQLALASASVRPDRAFLERTVGRVRELTGGQGIHWRVARARLLLSGQPTDAQASEATATLAEVAKAAPNHLPGRLLLAEAHRRLGNSKEAIQQLEVAITLDPASNRIALQLARLFQDQGDFALARQYLDRVIKNNTATLEERREVAGLLAGQGDSQRALEFLRGGYKSGEQPADLVLAALYRERNQPNEAEAIYKKLIQTPDIAAIQEAAGFYAAQGRNDEAERVLARLDQLNSKPGQKETARGQHHLRYGDPQQALGQFQAAAASAPAEPAAWYRLITTALVAGKPADAVEAAGRAIAALPVKEHRPFTTFKQHEQLAQDLAADETARLLLPGLLHAPDEAAAAAEALHAIAASKRKQATDEQTVAQLRKLADRNPRYLALQIVLAQKYLASRSVEDAAALASRAMHLHPRAAEPAKLAVDALVRSGKWNDALDAARQWRERSLNQPLAADQMIALSHLALGQPNRAVEQLQPHIGRATAAPDQHRDVLALYCQAKVAAGKPDEAAGLLKPLLAKSPEWREVWVALASQGIADGKQAAAWLNDVAAATRPPTPADQILLAQGWTVLAQRTKDPSHAQTARAALDAANKQAAAATGVPPRRLLILGMLQEQTGNAATAEATYARVLKADPNVPEALNNLAMLIVTRGGDMNQANEWALKAVALAPNVPSYQDTLATVQAKRKEFDKAIASLQNAVRLEPNSVKWRIYLGNVLVDAGQQEKAKAVLKDLESMGLDPQRLPPHVRQRLVALQAGVKGGQAQS